MNLKQILPNSVIDNLNQEQSEFIDKDISEFVLKSNCLSNTKIEPSQVLKFQGIVDDTRSVINYLISEGWVNVRRNNTVNDIPIVDIIYDKKLNIPEVLGNIEEETAKKFLSIKANAASRGIEFTLTLNDVKSLLKRKTCYFTKVRFDGGMNRRSIDRLDHTKGYTKDNTVACTIRINQIKASLFEKTCILSKKELRSFLSTMQDIL